jgi:isoprenylcysteine carboxyl methyltransferase (ICMT) family protein YpbQ
MSKNQEAKDFSKYLTVSIFIFLSCLSLGWLSDKFFHFSGFTLIIITSIYAFSIRYLLLKLTKFNKDFDDMGREIGTIRDKKWQK